MPVCWSQSRQHPIHFYCVGELKDHLIYYTINADGARDRCHICVGRHLAYETARVKHSELIPAERSRQHWNVADISVLNHGFQCSICIARHKLRLDMLVT